MKKNKSISLKAYNNMSEYYYEYIDTKSYNAYCERPVTLSLLPVCERKGCVRC